MASGFPGGGGGGDPGYYGWSIGGPAGYINSGTDLYRIQRQQQQQQQFVGNLGDQSSQIAYRKPDLRMIGKRSLAEFQSSSFQPPQGGYFPQQQGVLANRGGGGGLFMRSLKQRTGFQSHVLSPISPLSPSVDPSGNNFSQDTLSSVSSLSSASYGVPLYHHQVQHQQYPDLRAMNPGQNSNLIAENSKKMTTLEELEKELLDDDTEGDSDTVSAITNSEWSQSFEDLISPNLNTNSNPNPTTIVNTVSPSPISPSSSCSSSKTPPPCAKPSEIISEAATAIIDGKSEEAADILSRLALAASPSGDPEQKLAFYMLKALRCHLSPTENPPPVAELYGSDHLGSLQALYELSPCYKFALLSSNLLILEAITTMMQDNQSSNKVVHIVDFDIGHGRQYINLLRALVERASHTLPNGRPLELKITAVETELNEASSKRLEGVRDILMRIATEKGDGTRFTLRFNSVTRSIFEVSREAIGCDPDETLVVNFAFLLYRVPDESVSVDNLRDELLRRVKGMQPRVVTLAEQELNSNTAPFVVRVADCAAYYGAILDSLEVGPGRESPERARVEEALGRKMANAIGCEGSERVERCEVFGKWRARMGMAGFKAKAVGQGVAESMRGNLTNPVRGGNPGFTVKEENGGLWLGWMGRTVAVASAWR